MAELDYRKDALDRRLSVLAEDQELVVGRSVKTEVLKEINHGSFGEIHLGRLQETGEDVIVKLELQSARNPQLLFEGNVYRHLEGGPGIPKTYWFGLHEPLYNVLVMERLGPSLQDLFFYCGKKFSLKTTLLLLDQMIDILEFFHKNSYVHRDIKPDNFMMGRGENRHKVYIIDFGLAKKISGRRRSSMHFNVAHPLVGTARYASLHAHLGHDESPRDDMEALAYVFIYFLQGKLPWQGLLAYCKEEKFAQIKELKMKTPLDELCAGQADEFKHYLHYTRRLQPYDRPDYAQVKELFRNLAEKRGIDYDNQFDWVIRELETGVSYLDIDPTENIHLSSG